MKVKVLSKVKKLLATALSAMLVITAVGLLPMGVANVEAAGETINASDASFKGVLAEAGKGKVTINMDTSKSIDALFGDDIVIKGSGTLTIRQTIYVNSLTIESGANVVVKGEELGSDYNPAVQCEWGGSMTINGTLTVTSTIAGLRCRGPLSVSGTLDVSSVVDAVVCDDSITVNGGTLKAKMSLANDADPLYGTVVVKDGCKINMTGGVSVQGSNDISLGNVVAEEGKYLTYLNEDGSYVLSVTIKKGATEHGTDDSGSGSGSSGSGSGSSGGSSSGAPKYSNEWVNGKWYDASGNQTYTGTLSWKSDASGWWVEDSDGWYPWSQWQKIDGKWYYFDASGYMASNEWRDGYWLGSDGSISYDGVLSWKSDASGWWVEDSAGWYPVSQWQKINGSWYYFGGDGYMVTNNYVDGYWLGADGACW